MITQPIIYRCLFEYNNPSDVQKNPGHSWKLQSCLPLAGPGGDCACAPPYGEHLRWLKAQQPSCRRLCQFDPRRPWCPLSRCWQPGWVQPPDSPCREGVDRPEMHLWTARLPHTETEEGELPGNEAESWENAEEQSCPDLCFKLFAVHTFCPG